MEYNTDKNFEVLIEAIPDVVGVLDHEYGIIRYNTLGYQFFGTTHEDAITQKCFELFGRRAPDSQCAVTTCYETGGVAQAEKYLKDRDLWILEIASPMLDNNGEVYAVLHTCRDMTQTKKMELQLFLLERALNHSIDGIAVADMNGVNQYVNPAWARAHGYSAQEMLGESLYKFHPEEQLRDHVIPFFQKVRELGSHRGESEHTKKDGELFATYMMASLIKNDKSEDIGFVGTIRDISELKKAQRELENHRDRLEHLVSERTGELKVANRELVRTFNQIRDLKEQLEDDNIYLREEIRQGHNFKEMIGQSDPLNYIFYRIKEVAPTDTTVLILGESGTGKELAARAIHNNSAREVRPLVKVDCSSLPANLIESELFGHEKGAFSGAVQQRKGRFEIASGTTLFLDEIGELDIGLQAKFLRVLEYGEFERLGSSKTLRTDVRIIAATNRKLREEVEKGRFREDLWYRLNVYTLKIPSLRDRRDDIPLLTEWFVAKYSRKLGRNISKIPRKTMKKLMSYDWPGNIRELSNCIEAAIICSHDGCLKIPEFNSERFTNRSSETGLSMAEMEKAYIQQALQHCDWKIEGPGGAAERLDLNPGTLRGRMRKHTIVRQ